MGYRKGKKNTLAEVKGRISSGRRIKSPSEDSLGNRATRAVVRAGYDYRGGPGRRGAWVPPKRGPGPNR